LQLKVGLSKNSAQVILIFGGNWTLVNWRFYLTNNCNFKSHKLDKKYRDERGVFGLDYYPDYVKFSSSNISWTWLKALFRLETLHSFNRRQLCSQQWWCGCFKRKLSARYVFFFTFIESAPLYGCKKCEKKVCRKSYKRRYLSNPFWKELLCTQKGPRYCKSTEPIEVKLSLQHCLSNSSFW